MEPERWRSVKDVLQGALEHPLTERSAYIAAACAGDTALQVEVESLLANHDNADTFLEVPAAAVIGASVAALDQMHPGRRIGPYRLEREIGRGGMGVVYLASRDDQYQKQVAIKVVLTAGASEFLLTRFRQERQILALLEHPNIAQLFDGGATEDGLPYLVMEYVDGVPIDAYCDAHRLTIAERLALFRDICAGVQCAHQHLIVHRDIKPANILVTVAGTPKLLDFGVAKLLAAHDGSAVQPGTIAVMLTPEYASPEQIRAEPVTTASDVYSLGVLLYRLLTGRRPYPDTAVAQHDVARAICDDEPAPPSVAIARTEDAALRHVSAMRGERPDRLRRLVAGDLDTIVMRALQKDPKRRYASVDLFAEDVRRHLAGLPVSARKDTLAYRTAKFTRRNRAAVLASAVVVLALIAGIVATAWQARIARAERVRAERRFNDVRQLANSFLFEFHDAIVALPGSTKARELVVRRALQYLDSLAGESANDLSLQRELAAAYEKVGEVQGGLNAANLGNTEAALRSQQRALTLREAVAAALPSDATAQRDLATTYQHLGQMFAQMHDNDRALADFRRALAIGDRLLAANPQGVKERGFVASQHTFISAILSEMNDVTGALDSARKSADAFESLLAANPGDSQAQRSVAVAAKYLGARLEVTGDRAGAIEQYRRAIAIDEARMRANPLDNRTRLDLSYGYASAGYTLSKLGDVPESLAYYNRALALREEVAAADPHDANARDTVTRGHLSIARVLKDAGRFDEAIAHYGKARDISEARYAADPTNGNARERLANAYSGLGSAYQAQASAATNSNAAIRHWREARSLYRKSLDLWVEMRNTGTLLAFWKKEPDRITDLIAKADAALDAAAPKRAVSTR